MKPNGTTEGIGKRIAFIAKEFFGSQKKMAKEFNTTDVTVSRWVKGDHIPDLTTIIDICNRVNVSSDWLLFGKESSELDYNLFNEVTKVTYNWAKEKKVPINGTLFTGVYKTLIEERKHNKNITIQAILDKYEPLLQAIRGE